MDESWNYQILAKHLLDVMPKLSRLMVAHVTSLAENEATMMQMGVLHLLQNHPPMTTSDIAKHRKVSLQAASTFVQGLVDKGWVIRVEDPDDRRRSILEVTEAGRVQENALREQIIQHLSELLSGLSEDEVQAAEGFLTGLDRIVQQFNLDDICQEKAQ